MTTQEQQHIDREIRQAEKMLANEPRLGAAELAVVTHEPAIQKEWNDGDYVPHTFYDLLQYSSRSRQCIESEKDDEGSWHWVSASLLLPRRLSVTSQGRHLEDAIARLERQLNIMYHSGGEAAEVLQSIGWPDIPTVFKNLKERGKL